MALGTGLRLGELVGLNVGDVFAPGGTPKTRIRVRREIAKRGRAGDVFVPDRLVRKLKRFWRFKKKRGESLESDAPLFCAQSRRRLSKRRVQFAWREWQKKAGFDRLYPFHCLRHTSVTAVYRQTRDLFLAQRFARHASPLTTVLYTHPSDDEMAARLKALGC
jgi:integrase